MNSTNNTGHHIKIQGMIELNRCPGYFVNIKDSCLYSIKSGTVKRLKLQRIWRYCGYNKPRPTNEYGYQISNAGRRRTIPVQTCKDVVLEWTKLACAKSAVSTGYTPIVPDEPKKALFSEVKAESYGLWDGKLRVHFSATINPKLTVTKRKKHLVDAIVLRGITRENAKAAIDQHAVHLSSTHNADIEYIQRANGAVSFFKIVDEICTVLPGEALARVKDITI